MTAFTDFNDHNLDDAAASSTDPFAASTIDESQEHTVDAAADAKPSSKGKSKNQRSRKPRAARAPRAKSTDAWRAPAEKAVELATATDAELLADVAAALQCDADPVDVTVAIFSSGSERVSRLQLVAELRDIGELESAYRLMELSASERAHVWSLLHALGDVDAPAAPAKEVDAVRATAAAVSALSDDRAQRYADIAAVVAI